jgi:hypothetical protein
MIYKPLSDARHQPLSTGTGTKNTTPADEEVDDLPGGVFFSGDRSDKPEGEQTSLFYKDGTGGVRRVRFTRTSRFEFTALAEGTHFVSLGEILVVPEVDPRSWVAAREKVAKPPEQLGTLPAGAFFTALGASEHPSWHRRGVYRLGRDGMLRRLLKDPAQGLKWSDAIPGDRLGDFGQRLAVPEA